MTSRLPLAVTDKILELTLETNQFAYFVIDEQGVLVKKGGELLSMGLPDWQIGFNIEDRALFITGMIPMSHDYEYIPAYQLGEFTILDIHMFREGELCWTILVDKSTEKKWEPIARQTANELKLLRQKIDRENILNRGSNRPTQFDFFESLNMMVMMLSTDGSFELLQPVSNEFDSIHPEALEFNQSLQPQDKFPFVENFLIDAHEISRDKSNSKKLRSGPWIEVLTSGDEVALEAIALNWHGESLLFIEILDDNYQLNQVFLQVGREGVLMKNLLQHEVRKQTQEIRAREEEIALRLVCAADMRDDGETGSHIRRLGLYSELMAANLGWSGEDIDMIRIAAPMHDIGKIGIPDHILKKPNRLTDSEFDIAIEMMLEDRGSHFDPELLARISHPLS
jgi:hypothetical protein